MLYALWESFKWGVWYFYEYSPQILLGILLASDAWFEFLDEYAHRDDPPPPGPPPPEPRHIPTRPPWPPLWGVVVLLGVSYVVGVLWYLPPPP